MPTIELGEASLIVPCHRYVWESNATGGFAISEDKDGEPLERGTQIKLFLKVNTCHGVDTLFEQYLLTTVTSRQQCYKESQICSSKDLMIP